MSGKKASKPGKKKPAAKKKALTEGSAITRADFEMLGEQMREVIAVVEKLAQTIGGLTGAVAETRGGGGGEAASAARGLRATARALGCLDLLTATQIVQEAAGGPHDIDSKLRDIGFITDDQRRIFQEDVFNGVLDEDCDINRGDIPNGADNTLKRPRHHVGSDLNLLFSPAYGLTFKYMYGSLPPAFNFVDHKVSVGFSLQLKQANK